MEQGQKHGILSLEQLAANAKFSRTGLVWNFPDIKTAREHLRLYEPYFSHWGYQCAASDVTIRASDIRQWHISPRMMFSTIDPEASPVVSFQSVQNDPEYLLVAEQRLSVPLVSALVDIQENPGIKGIVKWSNQKQVILTTDCSQISIGQELEDCLNYSRNQYWYAPDLEEFLRRCQQELRQDGSNEIDFSYLSFDPTTGGDWIRAIARYRMIDAGRLGIYQMCENIEFDTVAAPV